MTIAYGASISTQFGTASGTSQAVDLTAAVAGDLMIIPIVVAGAAGDPGAISLTCVGGETFTKYVEYTEAGTTVFCRLAWFWKVRTGTEGVTTAAWSASGRAGAVVATYTGADPTGPLAGGAGANRTTNGTALASGSGTPADAAYWPLVAAWSRTTTAGNKNQTVAPDAALTERADVNNQASGSSPWGVLELADGAAAIGDTAAHTYTATLSPAASGHAGAYLVWLVPAPPPAAASHRYRRARRPVTQ